ncbi:MAG: hypothetical protein ACYS0C_10550 [Planctomycetota bacterium]
MAENPAFAAVSLNLGSCEIGALYGYHVNSMLDIDGIDESVICMAVLGALAQEQSYQVLLNRRFYH